jgi:hypothetical protein
LRLALPTDVPARTEDQAAWSVSAGFNDYDQNLVWLEMEPSQSMAGEMLERWDPTVYRERAEAWRERAASLPEADPNRTARLALAAAYERLADQLELRSGLKVKASGTRPVPLAKEVSAVFSDEAEALIGSLPS